MAATVRPVPNAQIAVSDSGGPLGVVREFRWGSGEVSVSGGIADVAAGATGPAGPQGDAGPTGPQGPTGLQGATGPTGADGSPGVDGATGAQGPQGIQGIPGPAGADGADGSTGPQGDPGPAGADGAAGAPGVDGATWRSGSGAPLNTLGVDGDFYLDTVTGDVYRRAAGIYSVVANIKGPTGADGADGADGAPGADGATGPAGADGADGLTILNGSGAPSSGLGVDGDFYLDTTAHAIYGPKTGGAWGSGTSLVGPTGATGPTGADGADGADGATGATGSTGPGYIATSATSFTPGTGSKAFTTQAGLAYTAGARIRASSAAGPTTTYMEGVCTAYTGTTLTVTVDLFAGTGAHTDWDINLAGDQGIQGAGVPPTVVAHGSMGATETFDYSAGPAHSGTVNAALTVTLTGWTSGAECILSLYLTTDGTGGHGAPAFGAEVVNAADLVWDDAAGAFNVIRLFTVDDGTTVYIATDVDDAPTLDAVLAVSSGENIADALTGAGSPSSGNVFATIADVSGGGGTDLHPGTSFPGSPATNELCYRTDLDLLFFYDGTRWRTTQVFRINFPVGQVTQISATTASASWAPLDLLGCSDAWLLDGVANFFVNTGGTALGASHKWVDTIEGQVDGGTTITVVATMSLDSGANGNRRITTALNATLSSVLGGTIDGFRLGVTKTGTPGTLFTGASLLYQLIAT